jgi:predicted RNA-binding protein with RPS1 domain
VRRLEPFGAFVELAPGLEGLVHISEIGGGRRLNHAREAVQPGQEVQVRVLGVDTARRRISLSMAAVGGGGGGDQSERSERGEKSERSNRGDRGDRGGARDGRRDDRREEFAPSVSSAAAGSGFGSMADFFSRSKKR